jgi:hypothetical protein
MQTVEGSSIDLDLIGEGECIIRPEGKLIYNRSKGSAGRPSGVEGRLGWLRSVREQLVKNFRLEEK